MSRALIVGSSSMLGRELVRQWQSVGDAVITSTRSGECDVPYDLASLQSPPLADGSVDVVFVCASNFAGDSWDDCIANSLVNTVGMYRIAEWAARLHAAHIVLASSASAWQPASSYGLSKAQGEHALQWASAKAGCKFTALQFPQLFDDLGECGRHQPWFARIVAHTASGKDLRLAPNDQCRNFLHVCDAARAMTAASQQGLEGVHALTTPDFSTYREIATIAYDVFAAGGQVVEAQDMKPFRPSPYPPASEQALALLGGERVSMRATFERIKALNTASNFAS
jgi:nucleoside-diphosphate-sugar epimerase